MARCMLLDAKMYLSFWGEAVTTANFVQNRLPWKNVNKTPFEYWYNRKPIYTNLKRFGADCYVKISDENRRKLNPKIQKGILLGVDMESKAYRIYVPRSRKVLISKDVKFIEEMSTLDKLSIKSKEEHIICEDAITDESNIEINESTIQDNSKDEDDSHNQDSNNKESATEDSNSTEEDTTGQLRRSERQNKGIPPQRLIQEISVVTNDEP